MQWYYSKNGMQLGPVSGAELRGKWGDGEVLAEDLVWREGMQDWQPLGQVAELQAAGTPLPENPDPAAGAMGSVPTLQPTAYPGGYAQQVPNHLVASIVATVIGGLICTLIALPMGIVAIVYASKVEALQMRGDIGGAVSASKTAKTWMICSFVCSVGLGGLIVVALLVGMASGM